MAEESSAQSDLSQHAVDSMADARRAVLSATTDVKANRRHLRLKLARENNGRAVIRMLEDGVRAAPLAMLAVAFIAGVMISTRRRF